MTSEEKTAWSSAISRKSDSPVDSEPYLIIARGKGHYYFYRGSDGKIYYESDIDKEFDEKMKPRSAKRRPQNE